ncbi:hypothetical protein KCU67_g5103, partial [Aureobasidium melanogenum]
VVGGGHIAALKRSVKDPADLLSSLPADAVSTAALYGRDQMLVFLLDEGLSIEAEGPFGTPLRVACLMNHQYIAQLLIAGKADVIFTGSYGDALQAAALKGHLPLVRLLLDNGADVNAMSGTYGNALQAAAYHGHIDVITMGSQTPNLSRILIKTKAATGYNEEGRFIMTWRLEERENCVLLAGVISGRAAMVQSLLQQRITLGISDDEIHDSVIQAAYLGSLQILRQLLEVADDTSIIEALECAAIEGHVEIVDLLLEHTAVDRSLKTRLLPLLQSTNATLTENGLELLSKQLPASEFMDERYRALTEVAERSSASPRAIQLLLRAQPSIEPHRLRHVFRLACQAGNLQMALILFDALGQVDCLDDLLSSCLGTSAAQGRMDMVLSLVGRLSSDELSSRLEVPIALAAGNGYLAIVETLYKRISSQGYAQTILSRTLVAASGNGHLSIVKFILDIGTNVNAKAPTLPRSRNDPNSSVMISPLQACLLKYAFSVQDYFSRFDDKCAWNLTTGVEHKAVLKLLIDFGADPNDLGGVNDYAIFNAASHCDPEDLQRLIIAGADVNAVQSGDPAIHAVVKRELFGHTLLRQLLNADAILPVIKEAINPLLDDALDFFLEDGRFTICGSLEQVFDEGPGAIVLYLLTLFPEEEVVDKRYGLVLQMAACLGRTPVIEMLLKRGIDVNIAGHHFGTALQAASYHGNLELAKLLLRNGANPNILQGAHQTALRAAVVGNHKDLVNLLIDNDASLILGADVQIEYDERSQPILHLAVQNAAVDVLQILLSAGVDVKAEYPGFEPPLITACEQGDYDKVEVLIDAGLPVDVRGLFSPHNDRVPDERVSALHMACHKGFNQIASVLLDHGADPYPELISHIPPVGRYKEDPEEIRSSGSALELAAKGGHLDCIQLILAKGTKANSTVYGSALLGASGYGHIEVVQEFLSRNLGTAYILDACLSACRDRHFRVVETLLETMLSFVDRDIDEPIKELLRNATKDKDVFEFLLEYSVVDTDVLISSCIAGSLTGVRLALENGISIDAEDGIGRRGLHTAAYNRHLHIIQELVDRGASVDSVHSVYGGPLVLALQGFLANQLLEHEQQDGLVEQIELCKSLGCSGVSTCYWAQSEIPGPMRLLECERVVQFLLLHGARCNDDSSPHGNVLHLALFSGSAAMIQLVLDNGADINNSDDLHGTALIAALKKKQLDVFKLLLERGADPQYSTDEGSAPLHVACHIGLVSAIRQLISHGADVNARDMQGHTPLHVACRTGLSSAIRHLIAHGSNVNAKDIQGLTPLGYALQAQRETESWLERPPNLVETLLSSSPHVEIEEDHLHQAATITKRYGKRSLLQTFLDYDKLLVVSESVIVTFITTRWTGEKDLAMLLNRSGGLGVTAPMLMAVTHATMMKILLNHQPVCKLTPAILEATTDRRCLEMLLAYDDQVCPTEKVIINALRLSDDVERERKSPNAGANIRLSGLLDRNADLDVTQGMLKSASNPRDMECLLARFPPQNSISESVVLAAINKRRNGPELLQLLLDHEKNFRVSPKVIQQATKKRDRVEMMAILLQHDPNVGGHSDNVFHQLSDLDVLRDWCKKGLVEYMDGHGNRLEFTELR